MHAPLAHWDDDVQIEPGARSGTHVPVVLPAGILQWAAATQLESSVHDVAHDALVPLHAYGAQDGEPVSDLGSGAQRPSRPHASHAPLQGESQQTLSTQLFVVHSAF